uniref:VWFD domain-containing protein n=1 Tax=Spongospora subterranea TaxID=70186 RepID=A0A0H5R5R2_9EUKA|eukprot:CRZ03539.1 hypothetical protein [Spongospora subterranea]
MLFLLISSILFYSVTSFSDRIPVQTDTCTISGDPHIHNFQSVEFDYEGVGYFTAVQNDFLSVRVHMARLSTNHSYVRGAIVQLNGLRSCRSVDCGALNTLTLEYGVNISGSQQPDQIRCRFQSGENAQQDIDLIQSIENSVESDQFTMALNRTGVLLSSYTTTSITLAINISGQAPIMITIGSGFISMTAINPLLSDTTGFCQIKPDISRLYPHNDPLYDDAMASFSNEDIATSLPDRDMSLSNNIITFPSSYSLKQSLYQCRQLASSLAITDQRPFRQCVYDFIQTNSTLIGASNFQAMISSKADADYLIEANPTRPETIVQRRQTASSANMASIIISGALGMAFFIGVFANRRLRNQQSQQLSVARANAIRLVDHL